MTAARFLRGSESCYQPVLNRMRAEAKTLGDMWKIAVRAVEKDADEVVTIHNLGKLTHIRRLDGKNLEIPHRWIYNAGVLVTMGVYDVVSRRVPMLPQVDPILVKAALTIISSSGDKRAGGSHGGLYYYEPQAGMPTRPVMGPSGNYDKSGKSAAELNIKDW
jgi:hypothetical protein